MAVLDELKTASHELTTAQFLRHLIEDRFPGKTVVTASLRSTSIIVLKMVSDIDPATPVVFCRRGTAFPESREFHDRIVALLGLTNVSVSAGHEPETRRGDHNHCEEMWVEHEHGPGRSFEIAHLNETLTPFDCWVSAVYHVRRPEAERHHQVDMDGRLYRIDLLAGWSRNDVREFMRGHDLPYHKRAYRTQMRMPARDDPTPIETYNV